MFNPPTTRLIRQLEAFLPMPFCKRIWLEGPEFLRTDHWPFKPTEDFRQKQKRVKLYPTDELVTESSSMLSEVAIANTFDWQKHCSYEKRLRIDLRFVPKNSEYRTNTGAIMDLGEFENAEQRLCYLTQKPRFRNLRCQTPHSLGCPTFLGPTLVETHSRSTLSSKC